MKNSFKFLSLCLSLCSLASCSDASKGYTLYKAKWENGKYFESFNESETSKNKVYVTIVDLSNSDLLDLTFQAKDFSIKGEDKVAHDALYFVSSYGFSQSSLNPGGRSVTISYIKEKKDTVTASKKENARDSFLLAFDVDLGDSFTLTYNDTVLKELSYLKSNIRGSVQIKQYLK